MLDRSGPVSNFDYCPCLMTVYKGDFSYHTECPNCNVTRNSNTTFEYKKLEARITTMMLNPEIFKSIMDVRSKVNGDFLNGVQDGDLFQKSLPEERLENESLRAKNINTTVIYLSVGIAGDGVNLRRKGYKGIFPIILMFMDLPPSIRTEQTFVHIPMVTETVKQSPGYLAKMFEPLVDELETLGNNGMSLKIGDKEYIIKLRVISITGDIIAVKQFTETLSPTAKHPCTFCNIESVERRIYFLDRNDGWQKKTREERRVSWEVITAEEVNRMIAEGDLRNESRGKKADNHSWQVKAKSLVSILKSIDSWRVLVSDYMHVFYENISIKSVTEVLGSSALSQLHPLSFKKFQRSRTDLLSEMQNIQMFEENKSASHLFSLSAMNSGIKATDCRTATVAFNALFKFLYSESEDAVTNSAIIIEETAEAIDPSGNAEQLSNDVNAERSSDEKIVNTNSINASVLASMKSVANDGGLLMYTIPPKNDFIPPVITNCFQVFDLTSPDTTGQCIIADAVSNTATSKNSERTRKRVESEALGSGNFERIAYMLMELNQFIRLICSIDIPRYELKSVTGTDRVKESFLILMEEIQLQSEKSGFEFLNTIFELSTHCLFHMIPSWPLFINFADIWCFVTERVCKKVKNLVKLVGGLTKTLNKRMKAMLIAECIRISAYKFKHLSYVHCGRTRFLNPANYPIEVAYFEELFSHINDFKIRKCTRMNLRGSLIALDIKGRKYAKLKNDKGIWEFIEITSIFLFDNDQDLKEILLFFEYVDVEYKWKTSMSCLYELCLASYIRKQAQPEKKKMFLTDITEIRPINTLSDGHILDKSPNLGDLFRRTNK